MELIQNFVDLLIEAPDWALYLPPALILVLALLFVFARQRGWYFPVALVPAIAGFLIAQAK